MSWIWEKSATWRKLVAITKHSPAAMVAFTVAMVVVPYGLGKVVMTGTNPQKETDLERQLRSRATLEHKVLARANRERLAVLLSETQKGDAGSTRYAAALRGESLGTHSRGTTTGARGIKQSDEQGSR